MDMHKSYMSIRIASYFLMKLVENINNELRRNSSISIYDQNVSKSNRRYISATVSAH